MIKATACAPTEASRSDAVRGFSSLHAAARCGVFLFAGLLVTAAAAGEAAAPPATKPGVPAEAGAQRPVEPAPGKNDTLAEPKLDLAALEKRLKETDAIGFLTKLTLKNQVDDLLDRFRAYHNGGADSVLAELKQAYELLLMKTIIAVQDGDPSLASAITSSRDAIWSILTDRDKFAALAAGV